MIAFCPVDDTGNQSTAIALSPDRAMETDVLGKIIGALVGAEVGRSRQNNGLKGAVVGTAAVALMRRMGPLGLVLGGAYTAKKMYDRRKADQSRG